MLRTLILTLTLGAATATAAAQEAKRAFLGVSGQILNEELRAHFKLPNDTSAGFVLTTVEEDSAAAKAGFRAGDVIVSFDGKEVTAYETLRDAVAKRKPGDKVAYMLRRGSGTISGTVVLGVLTEREELVIEKPMVSGPLVFQVRPDVERRLARLEALLNEVRQEIEARMRARATRKAQKAAPRKPTFQQRIEERMDRLEAKLDRILAYMERQAKAGK